MASVKVTELRQNLPTWLARVQQGEMVEVTHRGRVIARLVPPADRREQARAELLALRTRATVGDVVNPIDLDWEAAE